ncbi:hypothetical protein ACP179_08975 [Xenorhabdus stockiae]|uniref:hypothetical protein n=1 Tax=Xenorhabdus stockiae TaxID=351614 RepID=UPI003CE9BDFE
MKVFSTCTEPTKYIELTRGKYDEITKQHQRYIQQGRRYALCPECQNPVMLINYDKDETEGQTLHARHYTKTVDGVADYSQIAYDNCNLAYPVNLDSALKRHSAASSNEIKKMYLAHMDLIVPTLEQAINITFNENLRNTLIAHFGEMKGYEYRAVTIYNLPIALAYLSKSNELLNSIVNHDIAEKITQRSASFQCVETPYSKNKGEKDKKYFVNRKKTGNKEDVIFLYFTHHKTIKKSNSEDFNDESIKLHVAEMHKNAAPENAQIIYEKTISWNSKKFYNTLMKRIKLLDLAKEHLK